MDIINYEDFAKVDIRVGTVVSAEVPEGSKKVIKLEVDFGEELGNRIIFSGIKEFFGPDDLVGVQLPFVVNFPAKKMGSLGESNGMLVAASPLNEDESHGCVLFKLSSPVPNGTKVI